MKYDVKLFASPLPALSLSFESLSLSPSPPLSLKLLSTRSVGHSLAVTDGLVGIVAVAAAYSSAYGVASREAIACPAAAQRDT